MVSSKRAVRTGQQDYSRTLTIPKFFSASQNHLSHHGRILLISNDNLLVPGSEGSRRRIIPMKAEMNTPVIDVHLFHDHFLSKLFLKFHGIYFFVVKNIIRLNYQIFLFFYFGFDFISHENYRHQSPIIFFQI